MSTQVRLSQVVASVLRYHPYDDMVRGYLEAGGDPLLWEIGVGLIGKDQFRFSNFVSVCILQRIADEVAGGVISRLEYVYAEETLGAPAITPYGAREVCASIPIGVDEWMVAVSHLVRVVIVSR